MKALFKGLFDICNASQLSGSVLISANFQFCTDNPLQLLPTAGAIGQNGDEKQDKSNPAGKVYLKNQHGETFTAKYVVITVPITILKDGDISFIPALPTSKKKAIDTIEMRGALKIVCRFKSQFWPDNLNLIYSVRGFVSQIWMYSRDSTDNHDKCHLVAGFETAEPAEDKIHLSEQEVLDGFLKHLDEIFRLVGHYTA